MSKQYSDAELADLADWAEMEERQLNSAEARKGFGALRQGADWIMRWRAKERQRKLEEAGGIKDNVTVRTQ